MKSALLVAAALAAGPSWAARVELVPEAIAPAAPSAAAAAGAGIAPLSLAASPLTASPAALAAAPVLAPAALAPAALTALPLAAPAALPVTAAAAARRADSRPTLIQSASAPLPELSRMTGGESAAAAEKDFAARAQLGAPADGGTPVRAAALAPDAAPRALPPLKPAGESGWQRLKARVAGRAPAAEREMADTIIPAWMREELPVAAAKLGLALTPERTADVLARSKVWVYAWHSRWTYEVGDGLPDGHYDPKFGIRVMLKTDWRKLKDPETHFRVLFAHEYTHWLQEEGLVTRRYGIEIPAVAVEQLRAMELVGWEGMKAGRVGFIAEGNRGAFESGRQWARGDMSDATALMYRGVLGGVAYEVGRIAGRPEAAWEFLNLVVAEKGGLKPAEAFERVTGLKK
jgi:hypothetical protein